MTFRILTIHIALFFCLITTFALLPFSQAGAVVNDTFMVEEAVGKFYKKYLEAVQNDMELDLKKQQQIHPAFAQKIENLIQEAKTTEPGFLGYDPILLSQEIPIHLEYKRPSVATPLASMLVNRVWDENNKSALCVYLYKKKDKRYMNEWCIYEIVDMDDPKNSKECTVWENIEIIKKFNEQQ